MESPDQAVPPEIRYYPDIDNNTDINSGEGQLDSSAPGSGKGKGKGRAFEDTLLSSMDLTPTKKTHTF